jgi:hypothetical protein
MLPAAKNLSAAISSSAVLPEKRCTCADAATEHANNRQLIIFFIVVRITL